MLQINGSGTHVGALTLGPPILIGETTPKIGCAERAGNGLGAD
jgi:hypothetical protein